MLHTNCHRNRHTGSWKQDFLSIYSIHGHGSHLGHVTSIMFINFHFLVPKIINKIWLKMAQWILEKKFQFLYVNNLRPPHKTVRFGYSIYSPMKQQKSTFNSYNLFLDVILIQNMVNVFLIAQILSGQPSWKCADQVAVEDFDEAFVKTRSIDLKGIIIHMHTCSSVFRCFPFHS